MHWTRMLLNTEEKLVSCNKHSLWMTSVSQITIFDINKCSIHKMVSFRTKCNFFPREGRIFLTTQSYWHHKIQENFMLKVRISYFSTRTYRWRKLTSSKHHSVMPEVALVSLIINLMWGEKRDFEINKPEKGQKCSFTASGLLINHCTPEMIQFEFRVELFGRISIYIG